MTEASSKGAAVAGRDKGGKFVPGHSYAKGRRGARNLLSEDFLRAVHKKWLKHGDAVIDRVIKDSPELFLKIVATLMPKVIDVDSKINVDVHHEVRQKFIDFETAYRIVGSKPPPLIEARIDDEQDEQNED